MFHALLSFCTCFHAHLVSAVEKFLMNSMLQLVLICTCGPTLETCTDYLLNSKTSFSSQYLNASSCSLESLSLVTTRFWTVTHKRKRNPQAHNLSIFSPSLSFFFHFLYVCIGRWTLCDFHQGELHRLDRASRRGVRE